MRLKSVVLKLGEKSIDQLQGEFKGSLLIWSVFTELFFAFTGGAEHSAASLTMCAPRCASPQTIIGN